MKFGVLPTLTRDYILSQITQEQIFEFYLGIRVQTEVLLTTPSVIRPRDGNPTFSFKYSDNGKLRARDWAGYFWGDCFDAVAHVLRLNATDKKSFNIILDQIARDFRLHKYKDSNNLSTGNSYDYREVRKQSKKAILQFQPRNWDLYIDKPFWKDGGGIGTDLLKEARVFPCQFIWLNNNPIYNYSPKDPAYAYYFTPNDIKIYFPLRKEYRFIGNTSYLQGIDLLKPDRIGIITKSYKDVLVFKTLGIQSVAPSSETHPISKEDWFKLKNTCDHWFSLMDFDQTGIKMALKLRRLYNIRPLFFIRSIPLNKKLKEPVNHGAFTGQLMVNSFPIFAGVKDLYDKRKLFGYEATFNLVNEVKEFYSNELDKYDLEVYNDLKWIYNLKY